MNQDLINLVKDVSYNCGMSDSSDWDCDKVDDTKLTVVGNPGPGAKVSIFWDMFDEPDTGYVLVLPGWDSNDIWMSGIVHIPKPIGCEKCECDPEWILLNKLLTVDSLKNVIIEE